MDLRDGVALSILPRLSRGPLTNQLREAIRGGEATRGRAHATLDTFVQRLGIDAPPVRAAIGGARKLTDRALDRGVRSASTRSRWMTPDIQYALAAIPDRAARPLGPRPGHGAGDAIGGHRWVTRRLAVRPRSC